jgi:hypothetical protein
MSAAWDYTKWIDQQATTVEAAMREFGRRGMMNVAVYVIPSSVGVAGRLVVADATPVDATDVVRFGQIHGSNVMRVPYPHLRHLLWHHCRSFSIIPIEGSAE